MVDPPITRPSLLIRVRDPSDADAWSQFVELYGPLVYQFGRKRGLQDADAADLAQTVFQAVSGQIRRLDYDPRLGSFRGWLFGVVRNQFYKLLATRERSAQGTGDTGAHQRLAEQPARGDDEEALWQQEYERRLFLYAAEQVRACFEASSWQAFWQTAVEGKGAKAVASELGMTVGAVYTAKSRVFERIKREIRQLHGEAALREISDETGDVLS
jgi:RNA polymerase sigma factor (sigma-70 family)